VSSVLPVDWDNNWSVEQQMAYSGHIVHLGVYIDDATLTFKVIDVTYFKNYFCWDYHENEKLIFMLFTDC